MRVKFSFKFLPPKGSFAFSTPLPIGTIYDRRGVQVTSIIVATSVFVHGGGGSGSVVIIVAVVSDGGGGGGVGRNSR